MKGNLPHEWKMDLNWHFVPTIRDMDDPERMEIVKKIWRDTNLIKYHGGNFGDIFGTENNKQISKFVEYSSRGMKSFKMDKNYWKHFHYRINVDTLYELREDGDENKFGLDDMDMDNMNGKKKRLHRKRKVKKGENDGRIINNNQDSNAKARKAKSVEPIDAEDDISIDLNLNNQEDGKVNNKKKNEIQKEVDKGWKLWKEKNNRIGDEIDKNKLKNKKKQKVSDQKSRSVAQDEKYKFKDKEKLSQFKKRSSDLKKRLKEKLSNDEEQKHEERKNKKQEVENNKENKYSKMQQIREQHKQNRFHGKQFKLDRKGKNNNKHNRKNKNGNGQRNNQHNGNYRNNKNGNDQRNNRNGKNYRKKDDKEDSGGIIGLNYDQNRMTPQHQLNHGQQQPQQQSNQKQHQQTRQQDQQQQQHKKGQS